MALLKVARLGHPILRQIAEPVSPEELASASMQGFIDDLIATMREYNGAGLAAPQVHVSKRIVLIEVDQNPRYPEFPTIPLTALVNPEITFLGDGEIKVWEGCLSVPGIRGLVPRHNHIQVKALDRHGNSMNFEAEGIFAAICQHECDHIDGRLFVDNVQDTTTFSFLDEFARFRKDEPHVVTD